MSEKLKVVFVNPMSYNNLSVYDSMLISNMQDVQISYYGSHLFDLTEHNFNVNRIYFYSRKRGVFKLFSYYRSQKILFRKIKKERPQIVHFQWIKIPHYDLYLLKKIKRLGIKTIFTAHNAVPHGSGEKYVDIFKKIYRTVDAVIVHAERTKEELVTRFQVSSEKIEVIPHGLLGPEDVDEKAVEKHVQNYRKQMKLEGETVFSALGILNQYKGIDITIDAWKNKDFHNNPAIKLIIGGKGKFDKLTELDDCLNAHIINRFLTPEEFAALLNITDFLILPYRAISQSGILLTAMQARKRVIVSDVGGLTEPFNIAKVGYILKSLTPESLGEAMKLAMNEKNEYPGEEIWEKISEYYNWANIGPRTTRLYYQLVNSSDKL